MCRNILSQLGASAPHCVFGDIFQRWPRVKAKLDETGCEIRWVPHTNMVLDGLTKLRGQRELMAEFLETNKLEVKPTTESLEVRKKERESKGYNPR